MTKLITGKTGLMGLIGNPVEHSISPQMHNTMCEIMGIDSVYMPFHVKAGQLGAVVSAFRGLNISGFNVTIPYKTDIIEFLDEISNEAKIIGAVNTVHVSNGRLIGYNTDGQGFISSLGLQGVEIKGKDIVVIGAGGATRAIAYKMAKAEAKKMTILNRSIEKAKIICELIQANSLTEAVFNELRPNNISKYTKDADIIINSTPIGMYPKTNEMPVDNDDMFRNNPCVVDLIYNPIKTEFLKKAEKNGCMTINGLGMLIYQGIRAFEIWNNIQIEENVASVLISKFTQHFGLHEGF